MDTPSIKPYLERAIALHPARWAENTYESCRDILIVTLQLAGPEWGYVAKTDTMDGESVQPPGFVPFHVTLKRPDGQMQTVRIVGIGHDAAYHYPSERQVKVIVNSAANSDPRPEIHGPARLGGDVIPPELYRWHNPPLSQGKDVPVPVPVPPPVTGGCPGVARNELRTFFGKLDAEYKSRGRRNRALDGEELYVDNEGIYVWLPEFIRYRQAGKSEADAAAAVMTDIAKVWR